MATTSAAILKPRKTPRQARSVATVEAIFDATIQVLLAVGATHLTTTRVAEKAGVSVGTVYQYFPDMKALLHAVLKRHLEKIVAAVVAVDRECRGQKLATISDALVRAYVDAKIESLEASRALYRIAPELDIAGLQREVGARVEKSITSLLASASDARFADVRAVATTLQAAVTGATHTVLERGATPTMLRILTSELPKMCRAYLRAATKD